MPRPKRARPSTASESAPIPLFDNNVLQCFGAARELDLLKVFQPAFTTQRVAKEQTRTSPPHSQAQFAKAIADKWLTLHTPARPADILSVCEKNPKLSSADAELLLLAESARDDLFTDEKELHGFATTRGLTAYNVTETILLLENSASWTGREKSASSSTSTPRMAESSDARA